MKIRCIRYGNTNTGPRADAVPRSRATPRSIRDNPRYMGLRLSENGKSVTKLVDCSNGFTVVSCSLNARSAMRFSATPSPRGTIPMRVIGNVQYRYKGNAKWSRATRTNTNKK
jgi:hypothetical protein